MSGPKVYLPPPPMYSVNVFNGDLNAIFSIQSEIKNLIAQIKNLCCKDDQRGIQFGGEEFFKKNQNRISDAIASFSIEHPGEFGQAMYNHFKKLIREKKQKLKQISDELKNEKNNLEQKHEDYQSYLEYEAYFNRLVENFERNKQRLIDYLKKFSNEKHAQLISDAQEAIKQVEVTLQQSQFKFGFRNELSSHKEKIANAIKEKENEIKKIRNQLSDSIIDSIEKEGLGEPGKRKTKRSSQVEKKIEVIEKLIDSVEDENRKEKYREKFKRLLESPTQCNDEFFYNELHDEILNTERTLKFKAEIQKALKDINEMDVHSSLEKEKLTLIQNGLRLLERSKIGKNQIGDFLLQFSSLKKKNDKILREEEIKEKEKLFLKQQIVSSLRSLGYEVMTDLEVIDFSSETDFLFQIPDQQNYLNLRFLPDGTMIYNFLIPDDRAELSADQVELKLAEMKRTCEEFKSLLKNLSIMGLNLTTKSEKPISADALIKLPAKYLSRIKKVPKKAVATEPAEKKRYLE